MIDTAKLGMHVEDTPDLTKVEKLREGLTRDGQRPVWTGMLRNLRVRMYGFRLKIVGSLNKFVHGQNITPISRAATKGAIEEISDMLNVDIAPAMVRRLDLGRTFETSDDVSKVLCRLVGLPGHQTLRADGRSVAFTNSRRSIVVYDKYAESRRHAISIPRHSRPHLLRFELQLKSRLTEQLGREVRARDLYDEGLCRQLVRLWVAWYHRIIKDRQMARLAPGAGVVDVVNALASHGIRAGGWPAREAELRVQRDAGEISNRQYFRIRKRINEIRAGSELMEDDAAVGEFTALIEKAERDWT